MLRGGAERVWERFVICIFYKIYNIQSWDVVYLIKLSSFSCIIDKESFYPPHFI